MPLSLTQMGVKQGSRAGHGSKSLRHVAFNHAFDSTNEASWLPSGEKNSGLGPKRTLCGPRQTSNANDLRTGMMIGGKQGGIMALEFLVGVLDQPVPAVAGYAERLRWGRTDAIRTGDWPKKDENRHQLKEFPPTHQHRPAPTALMLVMSPIPV